MKMKRPSSPSTPKRKQHPRQGIISRQDLDVIRNLIEKRTCKLRQTKENHNRYFTVNQRQILQKYFDKNNTPSAPDEELIAQETGLKIIQIKRWFRQRRARARKTLLNDHNGDHITMKTNPLQLTAIPVTSTTPPLTSSFPPNQVIKPTCYRSSYSEHLAQAHKPECSTQFYDCCPSTLQLCDKLLQNMFGFDWIVKLRLDRHI